MKKIAVVEDNPDNRLLARVILEPFYQVVEYENGASAIEGLRKERPDVLLLDVSLPEMDGLEVLRRIRADDSLRSLPVIAITAHAMTGDREKYLATGFDEYVTKPILDERVLLDAIQQTMTGGAGAEPTAAAEEPPALEADALERLRRLGGEKFAAEMIDLFLDYAGKKIAEARRAQAAGDIARVGNAVHPIKSSAGNVGASQVQELATRIEALAKEQHSEPLPGLLSEIEQAFEAVKQELERQREPPP